MSSSMPPQSPPSDDLEQSSAPLWSARTSFTADSPYFAAYADSQLLSVRQLASSLQEISMRTKTFTQTGALMSEAMHRLAGSCRLKSTQEELPEGISESELLQYRREAMGEEMVELLQVLGSVSV